MTPLGEGSGTGRGRFRTSFTLIELVVVMTIIAISVAMVAVYVRGETPAQTLNGVTLEFESFCARVRFRAAEDGHDWVVRYDPESRIFTAERPLKRSTAPRMSDSDPGSEEEERYSLVQEVVEEDPDDPLPPVLKWQLPERFEFITDLGTEEELHPGEDFAVFRFFPDGAASGGARLVFKFGELAKSFEMSKLTGRLLVRDGDITEEEEDGEGVSAVHNTTIIRE